MSSTWEATKSRRSRRSEVAEGGDMFTPKGGNGRICVDTGILRNPCGFTGGIS